MVLVQIAITNAGYTQYFLNLAGVYKCKVSHFSYMYSGAVGTHEILIMRSSRFNFGNSTFNGFLFTNQSGHIQYNGESPEFTIEINGQLDLTITKTDGTAPTNFTGAVLTLDLEPIVKPQNKEISFEI